MLEVSPITDFAPLPADMEEQLEIEAVCQQEAVSLRQEKEAVLQQESSEDFPSELPDCVTLPPPEWPDSPPEDNIPVAEWVHSHKTHTSVSPSQSAYLYTLCNTDIRVDAHIINYKHWCICMRENRKTATLSLFFLALTSHVQWPLTLDLIIFTLQHSCCRSWSFNNLHSCFSASPHQYFKCLDSDLWTVLGSN